jgi:RNA polymerase sigma-B factor
MAGIANDIRVTRWLEEYVRRREQQENRGRAGQDLPLETLRARIAEHHAPLVEAIARRFLKSGEAFEDLVQEGYLGLLSALENYSTEKGVKFSTYATHFIAGSIRHYLRDRGNLIKEPAWLQDLCRRVYNTADLLTAQLGRAPHAAEIGQVLNLTEAAVEEVLATRHVLQIASFGSSDCEEDNVAGLVDPEKIRSDQHITFHLPIEDRIAIEEAMERLKVLEKQVLHEFFFKDLNQTEVGRNLGISTNYVSHILKNSTQKLRKILGEAELKERRGPVRSSIRDAITGLFTEAYLMARLEEEISRASRAEKPLSLLLLVVEGLPRDARQREEVWRHCAHAVRQGIRRIDMAGRYSDDGVAVILIETNQHLTAVAERVTNLILVAGDENKVALRVRHGAAIFPDHGRTARELLSAAQASLTESQSLVSTRLPLAA